MKFMLIEPVFSDLLSFVTLFLSSLDESHKTGLTVLRNLITELDLITDFNGITEFREVSLEYLQRVWERLANVSSVHLVLSHLGLAIVLMLRPFTPKLVMFFGLF